MLSIDLVRRQAASLGFEQCGATPADAAPHLEAYSGWIAKGYHGSMAYLSSQSELKSDPQHLLPGVRSIIAVGLNYHRPNPKSGGQPKIATYALGRDYHKVLRGKLRRLGEWVAQEIPGAVSRPCVDSAPIFERDYAHLAGLGWFGKNTMLIDSHRGSRFFIGLLLTSAEVECTPPAIGGCGTCTRCIDACPTGAIVFEDDRWQVDARRCISYLTIEHDGPVDPALEDRLEGWTFGCDICQDVCPFNHARPNAPLRGLPTTEPDLLAKREWPSLVDLSELPYERWDALTRGSAVRRAGYEGLRRNARLNLKSV
jgi:epoxyqueuosine reductase